MSTVLHRALSTLLVLLGALTLVLWFTDQNVLEGLTYNSIVIVFNAGLCFLLMGAALLLPVGRYPAFKIAQIFISLFVIFFSAAIFTEDLTDIPLGLDQLFTTIHVGDINPHPGRMAPGTAISFILSGFVLILLSARSTPWREFFLQLIVLSVLGLAIIGIGLASVRLELLYEWYRFSRMAIPTAVGFVLLSSSLWINWYAQGSGDDNHEDARRIIATVLLIIVVVTLASGTAAFGLIAEKMEQVLEQGLSETFQNQSRAAETALQLGVNDARPITTRLLLNKYLAVLDVNSADPQAREAVREDAQSLLSRDFLAATIFTVSGEKVAEVGHFTDHPALILPISLGAKDVKGSLLWDDSAILHLTLDIRQEDRVIGTVTVERRLEPITDLLLGANLLAQTAETRLCTALGPDRMQCLPTYRHPALFPPEPKSVGGETLPVALALDGQSGLRLAHDYLNRRVISAYGPIGDTGFGIVVKIDAAEFYSPLRERLQAIVIFLAMLSGLGILVLRLQLVPLANQLVKSEGRTKTIVNSVGEGIVTTRTDGIIQSVNRSFAAIFGLDEAGLVGCDISELIPRWSEASPPNNSGPVHSSFGGPDFSSLETTARHPDGRDITILLTISRMAFEDEHLLVGVVRDISERKRLEILKGEFIGTVSHELRTPLTAMRGSLGLVRGGVTGLLPENAQNLIDVAYRNCERLILLVNDILDIEKIESGEMRFNSAPVQLAAVVEQAAELNKAYGEKYNVKFVVAYPLSTAIIHVDAERFSQVMSNLMSNAAKFSKSGTTVEIFTTEADGQVDVSIRDYGSGIPTEFQSRIFGRFAQADGSDTKLKGGTGLGLNISKTLVEAMGGTIRFTSQDRVGTTFTVSFPIVSAA